MTLQMSLRLLLWPFSLLYGAIVCLKVAIYQRGWLKAKCLKGAVISVGNLTTGGTGKTPMVIWLAEKFLAEGKRVAILSRGYRGTRGTSDEIEVMKSRLQNRVTFGVGKDRFETGSQIEAQQVVDIFILDDGFQYLPLARQINILLVDVSRPLRNEFLLPAGRMREPTSALHRADIVVFTRVESQDAVKRAIQEFPEMAIFPSSVRLLGYFQIEKTGSETVTRSEQIPQPVFVFSGIGNPQAFLSDVVRWGIKVAGHKEFRDHHRYNANDLVALNRLADQVGARSLLTTEKDLQNIRDIQPSSLPIYFCKVALEIPDEKPLFSAIQKKLAERPGAAA